jgi:AraC-like DNA-binding protein
MCSFILDRWFHVAASLISARAFATTERLPAMTVIPNFSFSTSGLASDEAFEAWRGIMSQMFHIEKARPASNLPRGDLSAFLLGDIMANRSSFDAQRLSRDHRRVEATPDHLVLQLYRTGGYAGEMGSDPVRVARGQIAVCDLRRRLDVQANASVTIGLTVPRHLLDGIDLTKVPARLDTTRERLLASHITLLHQRVPLMAAADTPAAVEALLAALRRLFDPSAAADVLDAPELDADLLGLAERVIAGALASPDLSPEMIAEHLNVSRATLYRVFAPVDGVMRHVWSMRLAAVWAALNAPGEPRTLARMETDHGFKTAAHLSRGFKAQYGMTPSDWRAQKINWPSSRWQPELGRLTTSWQALGRENSKAR